MNSPSISNMNSDDCGCDSGINLLTNNQPNNLNPIQVNRNANNRIMNNYQNNMNQVSNNNNLNNLIQGNDTNNQLDEIVEENNRLKDLKEANLTDTRSLFNLFLIILLCFAVNEMAKYFINQSIRLNKGTSARFLYYPIGIFVVLVLFNMF